jgi:hypothetical protein
MNNPNNNVLTYFIKDIKDAKERAFYKQINNNKIIQILYKDELIYVNNDFCYNYIHNIVKRNSSKYIATYKSCSMYNLKFLYYKKDNTTRSNTPNYIKFHFTYKKYLNKNRFCYVINNNQILCLVIIYFKKYKYIMNYIYNIAKFTSPQILIPNKYELDYYCKFVNIYI